VPGRLIAIGDIHGCSAARAALEAHAGQVWQADARGRLRRAAGR
jgi:hypothetical protein